MNEGCVNSAIVCQQFIFVAELISNSLTKICCCRFCLALTEAKTESSKCIYIVLTPSLSLSPSLMKLMLLQKSMLSENSKKIKEQLLKILHRMSPLEIQFSEFKKKQQENLKLVFNTFDIFRDPCLGLSL